MPNKLDNILTIGAKIWHYANSQAFTKTDFAKKMGISRTTLDNWINGETNPDYDKVQLASKILGIEFGNEPHQRSFRDEIFEGDYIGMHKRVWGQLEGSMDNDRKLLLSLAEALRNLTNSAGNQ